MSLNEGIPLENMCMRDVGEQGRGIIQRHCLAMLEEALSVGESTYASVPLNLRRKGGGKCAMRARSMDDEKKRNSSFGSKTGDERLAH